MSLPASANTVYAPGSQVKSADLNDLQAQIVALWQWTPAISPAAISGAQNDYNPTGLATARALRQDLSAAASITGLVGGGSGRFLIVTNIHASHALTLVHESGSSTAANRLALPGGVNYRLSGRACAILVYDVTSSRWRLAGGTGESMASRTRTFAVDGFTIESGTPANLGSMILASGVGDIVDVPISGLEVGRRITEVRIRGNDAGAGSFCRGELFRRATGSATQVGADLDSSSGATGSYNLANSGLTEDITSDRTYFLRWTSGAVGDSLQIIEITTEPTP